MRSLSPSYELITTLVLLNSVSKWRNATQFFPKMVSFYVLVCMGVGRFFPEGSTSGLFQKFFYGGQKHPYACV